MARRIKFTTPVGTAVYPHLNVPDTQFNPEGVYKTGLSMENCDELIELCNQLGREEFGEAAKFKIPFARDEDSGQMVMKCKSKYAPLIFDSTGEILIGEQVPRLWGGSTLKLGGSITAYSVSGSKGISLQLKKVQIINPVGGNDDGDNGFDAVEGGFKAKEITKEEFEDASENSAEEEEMVGKSASRF
jgi:hypothetical protein